MFQALFFFIISYRLRALKTLYFCKIIKKIIERIFAKNVARNYEKKNNTWNINHLVDESFVPATQQPSNPAYYIEDCRILGHSSAGVRMLIKKEYQPITKLINVLPLD